jgi:hypothetical protein
MLTLVHAPRSRSSRFLWLLEEIGEPYDIQCVSIRRSDGSGALDPANPHPHGKVPVLKDGGAKMVFEQTAIALYLADRFPDARLGPAIGDPGTITTKTSYLCVPEGLLATLPAGAGDDEVRGIFADRQTIFSPSTNARTSSSTGTLLRHRLFRGGAGLSDHDERALNAFSACSAATRAYLAGDLK